MLCEYDFYYPGIGKNLPKVAKWVLKQTENDATDCHWDLEEIVTLESKLGVKQQNVKQIIIPPNSKETMPINQDLPVDQAKCKTGFPKKPENLKPPVHMAAGAVEIEPFVAVAWKRSSHPLNILCTTKANINRSELLSINSHDSFVNCFF